VRSTEIAVVPSVGGSAAVRLGLERAGPHPGDWSRPSRRFATARLPVVQIKPLRRILRGH